MRGKRQERWERVSPASERQQPYLLTVLAGLVASVLFLLWGLQDGTGPWWGFLAPATPFLLASALALRAYRAGFYADRTRVRIRTVARTRTFRWPEVAALSTAPRRAGAPTDPLRSDAIHVDLRDGRRIVSTVRVRNPAEGGKVFGPVYERGEVTRFVAVLNDRLLRSREE